MDTLRCGLVDYAAGPSYITCKQYAVCIGELPEHTAEAHMQAIKLGTDFTEADTVLTKACVWGQIRKLLRFAIRLCCFTYRRPIHIS